LHRRGAPAEVAAEVVNDLVARGYVDDAAFARQWVSARAARGYGAARLRMELRARGVAPPVIAAALSALGGDDTLASARETARRRLPALRRGRPDRVAASRPASSCASSARRPASPRKSERRRSAHQRTRAPAAAFARSGNAVSAAESATTRMVQ